MVVANTKQVVPVRMEIVSDPLELAEGNARFAQYKQNSDWLKAHADEVYRHRGKFVCIAGQELFVGDTAAEAKEKASAAHPDDEGAFVRFIPLNNAAWIYAHRR